MQDNQQEQTKKKKQKKKHRVSQIPDLEDKSENV